MTTQEALQNAAADTIAFSANTPFAISRIETQEQTTDPTTLTVYMLAKTLEGYACLQQQKSKDMLMEAYITSLQRNSYSFGEAPQLRFRFSADL